MKSDASTLTLQDIADLARVRRPVVSMWRKRNIVDGELVPFPVATIVIGRVEHFDRDEVITWLERTGRGNNDDFKLDAIATAVPDDATLDELTSLLCLRAISGAELAGLTPEDLADLADELDPDDEAFLTEVEQLGPRTGRLTAYADELTSVAFSPADALERLENSRLGRGADPYEFSAAAVRLMGTVTDALRGHIDGDAAYLIDASVGRSRLALQVASTWREGACRSIGIDGDSSDARRQRRAALLRGLSVEPQPVGPALTVLPVTGASAMDAVRTIDELQLSLPADCVAVVIGPASLLCDTPADPQVEEDRDSVIRTGTLRFAARLPRGLWLSAPRQSLGLWVFGAQTARRPEDRALALADLGDVALTDAAIDDLATDAVASLGRFEAHAFRFARVARTAKVIASREVVPRGVQSPKLASPDRAERHVRIDALVEGVTTDLPRCTITSRAAGEAAPIPPQSIGDLINRRALRLRPGARLDQTLVRPGAPVRIFDPLLGRTDAGFDPIDLEVNHPRAARTEPGDVVFTHTPRPTARVDATGGCLVAAPARILRTTAKPPVGPYALAHIINRQPETAREWRSWNVPTLPADELHALEDALTAVDALRGELAARIDAMTELTDTLVAGVADRTVSLLPEPTGD